MYKQINYLFVHAHTMENGTQVLKDRNFTLWTIS